MEVDEEQLSRNPEEHLPTPSSTSLKEHTHTTGRLLVPTGEGVAYACLTSLLTSPGYRVTWIRGTKGRRL